MPQMWHGRGVGVAMSRYSCTVHQAETQGKAEILVKETSGEAMTVLRAPKRDRHFCPFTSKKRGYRPLSNDGVLGRRLWDRLQAKL